MTFHNLKTLLQEIHERFASDGTMVSAAWDGETMSIQIARPKSGKSLFAMRFEQAVDYDIDNQCLISDLCHHAKEHFN